MLSLGSTSEVNLNCEHLPHSLQTLLIRVVVWDFQKYSGLAVPVPLNSSWSFTTLSVVWISVKPEHFSKPYSFDKFFKQLERRSLYKVSLHLKEDVVIPVWLVVWVFSLHFPPKIEVYWAFWMKSDWIVCCQRLGVFLHEKILQKPTESLKITQKVNGLIQRSPTCTETKTFSLI